MVWVTTVALSSDPAKQKGGREKMRAQVRVATDQRTVQKRCPSWWREFKSCAAPGPETLKGAVRGPASLGVGGGTERHETHLHRIYSQAKHFELFDWRLRVCLHTHQPNRFPSP